MTALMNKTTNTTLIPRLGVADNFFTRGKGLLGRSTLSAEEALWIHRCNSIHTYFMKFPIDCVFVDRDLKVKKIYRNVGPWKFIFPVWGASSVIEMSAGTAADLKINVGDQLHVGA